jgi:hypothetical protein
VQKAVCTWTVQAFKEDVMRKLATVLSLLLAFSICLAAFAPAVLADTSPPVTGARPPDTDRNVIEWTPTSLVIPVAPGETGRARAVFSSRVAIPQATLVVSFPLSRYLRVEPSRPFAVVAGSLYPVELSATLPEDSIGNTLPAAIAGTVQVMGQGIFQKPLMVTITRVNNRPAILWTPNEVRLGVDLPEITNAADLLPSTAEVSFTTAVTITGARIRATAPLDRVLDISDEGPRDLFPGATYRLQLTAHAPDPTTVSAEPAEAIGDADPGSARRLVSGQVQIYTSERVYAKSLPVTVVLMPTPVRPSINWRPPVVTLRVPVGGAASQVVTMTSNITIENASLKVVGAISPLLTADFVQADPVTILPNTPYRVQLTVAAATADAFVNRPYL